MFFDQPIKNNKITYESILKNCYSSRRWLCNRLFFRLCLLQRCYGMIATDLIKQQELDAGPKAIQQISFTANLDRARNTRTVFILEEAKETVLDFSEATVKVL